MNDASATSLSALESLLIVRARASAALAFLAILFDHEFRQVNHESVTELSRARFTLAFHKDLRHENLAGLRDAESQAEALFADYIAGNWLPREETLAQLRNDWDSRRAQLMSSGFPRKLDHHLIRSLNGHINHFLDLSVEKSRLRELWHLTAALAENQAMWNVARQQFCGHMASVKVGSYRDPSDSA